MGIDTTTTGSVSGATASQGTSATPSTSSLGKNDFLKLLTAQLANQDPLNPVDNQAFIAQLAQFSSLEQLQNVSTRLDSLIAATTTSTQLGSASLVGKTVSYRAAGLDVVAGQTPPAMQVNLSTAASVTAIVQDAAGRTVRTMTLGARAAGLSDLGWDGRDESGQAVPAGHYTIKVGARTADGTTSTVELRATGTVQGVELGSGSTQVVVGGSTVSMSDVFRITQP